jgi:hypothetical protein
MTLARLFYRDRNIRFVAALFRQHAMTKHRKWRPF